MVNMFAVNAVILSQLPGVVKRIVSAYARQKELEVAEERLDSSYRIAQKVLALSRDGQALAHEARKAGIRMKADAIRQTLEGEEELLTYTERTRAKLVQNGNAVLEALLYRQMTDGVRTTLLEVYRTIQLKIRAGQAADLERIRAIVSTKTEAFIRA